jgi:signal transduction histidine kinase
VNFLPHGTCYLWDPRIVWLHVVSDGIIALCYYCIPFGLIYLVWKRRDLPFNWIFWMFGLFILGCGTTHFMEIWTVWRPVYLLSGVVKAATAAVSIVTAVLLIPLLPKAVALPSPQQLHTLNQQLRSEVAVRSERERELMRLAREHEAANRELEAFTYSVSHDLRAPLRHITGFSRMLAEECGPALNPQARYCLNRIDDSARGMATLVDELLNLSLIGRRPLKIQWTDLKPLIDEVIIGMRPDLEGRNIVWTINDLPRLEADPALLKIVFQNLLGNAVKYTRPRPDPAIDIGSTALDGEQVIFVRDNGVGFDMKYADKLFGVFQRLHRSEDFEGTGIGLATVQRIVQKHGWRIWASAAEGQGATFYLAPGPAHSAADAPS